VCIQYTNRNQWLGTKTNPELKKTKFPQILRNDSRMIPCYYLSIKVSWRDTTSGAAKLYCLESIYEQQTGPMSFFHFPNSGYFIQWAKTNQSSDWARSGILGVQFLHEGPLFRAITWAPVPRPTQTLVQWAKRILSLATKRHVILNDLKCMEWAEP
jgi:hypothetical protein